MKKVLMIALVAVAVASACNKSSTTTTADATTTAETIDVALASGSSYKYTISAPSNIVSISTDAQNASLSRISIVPGADSLTQYEYVPSSTFTGTDAVTIIIAPDSLSADTGSCHHGHHGHHPGGHEGGHQGGCGNGGGHDGGHHGHHGPPPADSTHTCKSNAAAIGAKQITLRFTVNGAAN